MPPGSIDTEDAYTHVFVWENGTKDLQLLDCNHWHNRGVTDTETQLRVFVINYGNTSSQIKAVYHGSGIWCKQFTNSTLITAHFHDL